MVVVDSGIIVAAAVAADRNHRSCVELLTGLRLAGRTLLVPATVLAEVGYLLEHLSGPSEEARFVRAVADGDFTLIELLPDDLDRMATLIETYADFPLGTTDASVAAVAERLHIVEIATTDRRHFAALRPSHVDTFTLLPEVLG